MESYIKDIIRSVSSTFGDEFFSAITLQLDKAIKSDYTFIARLDKEYHVSSTVALVANGQLVENIEYSLTNSPCKDVSDDSVCIYTKSVIEAFPQEQLLIDMKIEGYLGMPLHDSTGKVMGLVVGLYEKEISDEKLALTLFQLFSGRIAAEFDRLDKENQLKKLNSLLDSKVKERTHELELALNNLHSTQDKLVEIEKMAALGDLVSGVAHEVNTPLGVAITAESFLSESFDVFNKKLTSSSLTMKDMEHFVVANNQSLPMIAHNLERAKEIIDNFKSMATEQIHLKSASILLSEYYPRLISTLRPLLKRKKVSVDFCCCDNDLITTYPGCHAQVLTNLVTNSIQHGFNDSLLDNKITISIEHLGDKGFIVNYYDNGVGIKVDDISRVMEPFFTTARYKGNSGLGLAIAYNLITSNLSGSFECLPCDKGVHFKYIFKQLSP